MWFYVYLWIYDILTVYHICQLHQISYIGTESAMYRMLAYAYAVKDHVRIYPRNPHSTGRCVWIMIPPLPCQVGWVNRMKVGNQEKGFTGKELCQAAWQGAFEAGPRNDWKWFTHIQTPFYWFFFLEDWWSRPIFKPRPWVPMRLMRRCCWSHWVHRQMPWRIWSCPRMPSVCHQCRRLTCWSLAWICFWPMEPGEASYCCFSSKTGSSHSWHLVTMCCGMQYRHINTIKNKPILRMWPFEALCWISGLWSCCSSEWHEHVSCLPGGQNSFMESLSVGTPVVVCPGFADQPVNAQKAVDIGVGLQVTRPMCELEEVEQEILKYKTEVKAAVTEAGSLLFRIIMFVTCGGPHWFPTSCRYNCHSLPGCLMQIADSIRYPTFTGWDRFVATLSHCSAQEVYQNKSFQSRAEQCSQELRDAGGVDRAVDLLLGIFVDPQKLGGAWCPLRREPNFFFWHAPDGCALMINPPRGFCAKITALKHLGVADKATSRVSDSFRMLWWMHFLETLQRKIFIIIEVFCGARRLVGCWCSLTLVQAQCLQFARFENENGAIEVSMQMINVESLSCWVTTSHRLAPVHFRQGQRTDGPFSTQNHQFSVGEAKPQPWQWTTQWWVPTVSKWDNRNQLPTFRRCHSQVRLISRSKSSTRRPFSQRPPQWMLWTEAANLVDGGLHYGTTGMIYPDSQLSRHWMEWPFGTIWNPKWSFLGMVKLFNGYPQNKGHLGSIMASRSLELDQGRCFIHFVRPETRFSETVRHLVPRCGAEWAC